MSVDIRYKVVKMQIDVTWNAANSALDDVNKRDEFKSRYQGFDKLKAEYFECYISVEAGKRAGFDPDQHLKDFVEYDTKLNHVSVVYNKIFPKGEGSSASVDHGAARSQVADLPRISLPTFSGKITDWTNFINIFKNLIDENAAMKPVRKLHYLISCLSKEPLDLVKHLPFTDENYRVALTLLENRFSNTRLIADTHLEYILSLPSIVNMKSELRPFLNSFNEHIAALKALQFKPDDWSFILLHVLLRKIPNDIRNQFEISLKTSNIPKYTELLEFLENRCKAFESTCIIKQNANVPSKSLPGRGQGPSSRNIKAVMHVQERSTDAKQCRYCNSDHYMYMCNKFKNLNIEQRRDFLKSKNLCFNCFGIHKYHECTSLHKCKVCRAKHHTLICPMAGSSGVSLPSLRSAAVMADSPEPSSSSEVVEERNVPNIPNVNNTMIMPSCSASTRSSLQNILLGTALCLAGNGDGHFQLVRVFIDPGSQCSIISEECVQRLQLKHSRQPVAIQGVGPTMPHRSQGLTTLFLKGRYSNKPLLTVSAIILKRVTGNLPSVSLSEDIRSNYQGLQLADDNFHVSRPIDILLGSDIYNDISCGEKVWPSHNLPAAYLTVFGYVIIGDASRFTDSVSHPMVHHVALDDCLTRFWEIEQVPETMCLDPDDQIVENHFIKTVSRDEEQRFIVRLPFKGNETELGDSQALATRRLLGLERRFNKNPLLKVEYTKVLNEYLEQKHMEPVKEPPGGGKYYLAHHCVTKEESSTTKCRVVFDASMPTTTGISLNNVLHAGPKLQRSIVDIILRFRLQPVAFTCDIKAMYRQVLVHPDDRNYQLILWRQNPDDPILEFRLRTVTFGVSSSPYLAMRCILQLADEGKTTHPVASQILSNQIFVDDVVTGAPDLATARKCRAELVDLLRQGCFELRKWSSNNKEFLSDLPEDICEGSLSFEPRNEGSVKVLGVKWNPSSDTFTYHSKISNTGLTKRAVLANIACIFDPCGWLMPVVFTAKSFMQRLWILGIGWDDPLPDDEQAQWLTFIDEFVNLSIIEIKRFILPTDGITFQLHSFCDASLKGYASVVYLRVERSNGDVEVRLLISKSKVAPIKTKMTIPRLELCGAVLSSKLVKHSAELFDVPLEVIAWCDSSIVLSWIRTPVHQLKMFEGNRVSQILSNTAPCTWRHVPSALNPADAASRGLMPSELASHPLWWSPEWLKLPVNTWPKNVLVSSNVALSGDSVVPEQIIQVNNITCESTTTDIIERYSSLHKLIKVHGYCLRFIHNLKHSESRRTGQMPCSEWQHSLYSLIKMVQQSEFATEIKLVKQGLPHRTKLRTLAPFLDAEGLLRVQGRLKFANLSRQQKHPVILPKAHTLTILLINYYHDLYLHVGAPMLLSLLRKQFWILSARSVIKQQIRKCYKCFKANPKPADYFMADLPPARVVPCKPFSKTGVDYAGPFLIKTSKLKRAPIAKAYLCVFVCMVTKACHLDLVSDLSTDCFIACLTRFIGRRGWCSDMYSDCGSNFVGTNNQLNELYTFLKKNSTCPDVHNFLLKHCLKWHFNPPSAPSMGGLWESAVKSAKTILKRTIGDTVLTFEELQTVFAKIESILNSRPLCPISDDPDDVDALTPAHLAMVGNDMVSLPEPDWSSEKLNRLSRWQLLQSFTQQFWRRWNLEYLHTLQKRNKWFKTTENLKVNDIVLIVNENTTSYCWKLARVVSLSPGRDGVVRVATLRTGTGNQLVRPVSKLCPLPSQH